MKVLNRIVTSDDPNGTSLATQKVILRSILSGGGAISTSILGPPG